MFFPPIKHGFEILTSMVSSAWESSPSIPEIFFTELVTDGGSAGELRELWDGGHEIWWSALSLFANLWHSVGELLGIRATIFF